MLSLKYYNINLSCLKILNDHCINLKDILLNTDNSGKVHTFIHCIIFEKMIILSLFLIFDLNKNEINF